MRGTIHADILHVQGIFFGTAFWAFSFKYSAFGSVCHWHTPVCQQHIPGMECCHLDIRGEREFSIPLEKNISRFPVLTGFLHIDHIDPHHIIRVNTTILQLETCSPQFRLKLMSSRRNGGDLTDCLELNCWAPRGSRGLTWGEDHFLKAAIYIYSGFTVG